MDTFKRNLRILNEPRTLQDAILRIIGRAGLLPAAIGLALGITADSLLNINPLLPTAAVMTAIIFFITAAIIKRKLPNPLTIALLVLIVFTAVGSIRNKLYQHLPPNHISNLVKPDQKMLTEIEGTILTEPHLQKSDWLFEKFTFNDPATVFYLRAEKIHTPQKTIPVKGKIKIYVNQPCLDLAPNQKIKAYCTLSQFNPPKNPGQFNSKKYMARQNIHNWAAIKSRSAITIIQQPKDKNPSTLINKLRTYSAQMLLTGTTPEDSSRATLQALLLGKRYNLPKSVICNFRKTGLAHYISLSGLHVGILLAFLWWIASMLGIPIRGRAIIALLALILFMLIVPPRAPTIRAALIAVIFCLSVILKKQPAPLNSTAAAALILLIARPAQLFEVGFQLSFACVIGILIFAEPVNHTLHTTLSKIKSRRKTTTKKSNAKTKIYLTKTLSASLNLLAVGIAAWLGGAAIIAHHFQTINPLAPLWTVITFPFVALILSIGLLKTLAMIILPHLGILLALILQALTSAFITTVAFLANHLNGQIIIGTIPLTIILLYYGWLISMLLPAWPLPRLKPALNISLITILLISLAAIKYKQLRPGKLQLTVLAVGAGQTVIARTPKGKTFVFDAGSISVPNAADRIIIPYLRRKGISRIAALYISHDDIDHFNAAPELLANIRTRKILAPQPFIQSPSNPAKFFRKHIKQKLIPITNKNPHPAIKIIHPDKDSCQNQNLNDNNKSQVTLITFANKNILLCSDIEETAQKKILQNYPDLKADIVLLPHHGSTTTTSTKFLKKLQSNIALASCSKRQHSRLKNIKTPHTKTYYTAVHGAITITINNTSKIKCKTHLSPKQITP